MISSASASARSRGFSVIERRPLFVVGLVPSAPMNEATLATSGSCADHVGDGARWSSIIRGNDTSGGASVTPMMRPVSCCGKKPFGTTDGEERGERDGAEGDEQRRALVREHPLEAAIVDARCIRVEAALGPA